MGFFTPRKAAVAAVIVAALTATGLASAYALGTVWIKPGGCTKVAKTRVCARPAPAATTVQVTVTSPPPPAIAFKDGTFRVGSEIQPGTYVAPGGAGCYWERLSGFSGNIADVIANDFVGAVQQTIVTIAASDAGFSSHDCGGWSRS